MALGVLRNVKSRPVRPNEYAALQTAGDWFKTDSKRPKTRLETINIVVLVLLCYSRSGMRRGVQNQRESNIKHTKEVQLWLSRARAEKKRKEVQLWLSRARAEKKKKDRKEVQLWLSRARAEKKRKEVQLWLSRARAEKKKNDRKEVQLWLSRARAEKKKNDRKEVQLWLSRARAEKKKNDRKEVQLWLSRARAESVNNSDSGWDVGVIIVNNSDSVSWEVGGGRRGSNLREIRMRYTYCLHHSPRSAILWDGW